VKATTENTQRTNAVTDIGWPGHYVTVTVTVTSLLLCNVKAFTSPRTYTVRTFSIQNEIYLIRSRDSSMV